MNLALEHPEYQRFTVWLFTLTFYLSPGSLCLGHVQFRCDRLEIAADRIVWQSVLGSGLVQAIAPFLNRTDAGIDGLDGRAEGQVLEEGFTGSAEVIGFASWHA